MSDFTIEQKSAFSVLAKKYNETVYGIVSREGQTEVCIQSNEEAKALDEFSNSICSLVIKDFPDIEGKDEDINADAEMVVFMIADILSESEYSFE